MRIVAVADTHLYHRDIRDTPDGDVFVHAGDLLQSGALLELRDVVAWLQELPHQHKIVVAGNHDLCFQNQRQEALALLGSSILYLEDASVKIGGVRFWGSPWQPAFHEWAFNLPRGQALAQKWALIPNDTNVLVTHGPPYGFGDRLGPDERVGCKELAKRVRAIRPLLHLFGHIHQDRGCWIEGETMFANVTTWEGECPAAVFEVRGQHVECLR